MKITPSPIILVLLLFITWASTQATARIQQKTISIEPAVVYLGQQQVIQAAGGNLATGTQLVIAPGGPFISQTLPVTDNIQALTLDSHHSFIAIEGVGKKELQKSC